MWPHSTSFVVALRFFFSFLSLSSGSDWDLGTLYFSEHLPWARERLSAFSGGWDLEAFEGFLPQVSPRENQSWLLCPGAKGSSFAKCQLFRQCRTREGAHLILAKRRCVLPKTQTRLILLAFGELFLGTVLTALPVACAVTHCVTISPLASLPSLCLCCGLFPE